MSAANDGAQDDAVCNLRHEHHGEHHDEERDGFADTQHHEVVHEALARFAEGVAGVRSGLAHVPGGSHHADAAEDADAEVGGPVLGSTLTLVQDEHHQEHAVNRLCNRRTHKDKKREERILALEIRLFPGPDGRNAKRSCSTPIMTEQSLVVLSPARLALAESLSGSQGTHSSFGRSRTYLCGRAILQGAPVAPAARPRRSCNEALLPRTA